MPKSLGSKKLREMRLEKMKKSFEAGRVFHEKPTEDPLKVCFDCTGTDLTHKEVYAAANRRLRMHAGNHVMGNLGHVTEMVDNVGSHDQGSHDCHLTEVAFIARNVMLGITWSENRWVLNVNNKHAHFILTAEGMLINGVHYDVKPYQEVLSAEYEQYCENMQQTNMSQITDLLNIC